MKLSYLSWILSILAAIIMLQTLYFKFTGAEESIMIFSTLGVEPWGRWLAGIIELVSSVLLLWPRFRSAGALLSLGTMTGAILSHLFVLGIEVQNDGGYLFMLAVLVLSCSIAILWLQFRISRNKQG